MSGRSRPARRLSGPPIRLVRSSPASSVRIVPDEQQQRVIDHAARPGAGPLLVLAGPGTGKSATLVESVAARVESGTAPERVLVLTFSRRAAQELRDRIAARLGAERSGATAWTFHAFCFACVGDRVDEENQVGRRRRLLSGPEQDLEVRELLAGHGAEGFVRWPDEWVPALGTAGFASEVRSVFARARTLGLEPSDLAAIAGTHGRSAWSSAADALAEYLDVLDAQDLLDYTELVNQAVAYAESEHGGHDLRSRYDAVFVDEYQDTDPAQERLLQAIAGRGRDLVAVGDPDQSIYAFRGAEVQGLLQFPHRFTPLGGGSAPVVALRTCRRSGRVLVDAARTFAGHLSSTGAAFAAVGRGHRDRLVAEGIAPGQAEIRTYPSSAAQYDAIADEVRRAHLDDEVAWGSIAVLVRSGARSIPGLQRALIAAGVPVEVAGDELPLGQEPSVAPLLEALSQVLDPDGVTPDRTRALLLSPLGGADPAALRRLGRALREEHRVGADDPAIPVSSDVLIHEAVRAPERLGAHDPEIAAPARRLGVLLQDARGRMHAGGDPHEVLWALWAQQPWRDDGVTTWADRLERAALEGGRSGRRADRDLDAVVALFELSSRERDRVSVRGARTFLAQIRQQQIPADTLAERAVTGDAVRVLTAHRSKGLEWDVVIVADVQADVWPDVRHRGSALQADRIGPDGPCDPLPASALLAEERRLFYVAITRARHRLLVTAVDSSDDDGLRPSRFIDELGLRVDQVLDRTQRPLTLTSLVADLRRALLDPSSPAAVREAAVEQLAILATQQVQGRPLVAGAHPDHWWGLNEVTEQDAPMYPADAALALSGSSLDQLHSCSLKWFLAHEVRGEGAKDSSMGFGSVVHALAEEVAHLDEAPDVDVLMEQLDRVWSHLSFEAAWQSNAERENARAALIRFLAWNASSSRELVGSEQGFEVHLQVAGRLVRLRGSMDRVELDDQGRVVIVDLKTGRFTPTGPQVQQHVQLGVYQLAVREGAIDGVLVEHGVDPEAVDRAELLGGAELVQLRHDSRGGVKVQQQDGLPAETPTWIDDIVAGAVERIASESFVPEPGDACSTCSFTASCPAFGAGQGVVA